VVCEEGEVELRWDWLENGDDLATEASVFGNPNGDRFYAVWNQELPTTEVDEHGETIFTNMDSEFRRIFYNFYTDVAPTASLEYVSDYALDISLGESVILIGSGRDWDHMGSTEVNPRWYDGNGNDFCKLDEIDDEGNEIYECEQEIELKAGDQLGEGMNHVHFRVKDNEGRWSNEVTVDIFVAEHLYQVRLPAIQVGY
jgi:hypothetical protein